MDVPRSRVPIVGAFVVVVLLVLLDQWSKAEVFEWIDSGAAQLEFDVHGHRRAVIAGEWLSFMKSCNPGAAFGRFGDFPHALVAGRIVAVLFLCWLLARADTGQRVVLVAMTLVLAGAIGNLVDNLWTGCNADSVPYGVRDFINVWFEPLFGWDSHFPSFNVADSCISVGAVLWVLTGFRHPKDDASGTETAPEAEA